LRPANKHLLQEAALWVASSAALFACVYFFQDIKSLILPGEPGDSQFFSFQNKPERTEPQAFPGEVRLKADPRGHFVFTGDVDGRPVTFMADTGASIVALTFEDARRAGLSPYSLDYSARVSTANGVARVAPVTLARVRVGSITLSDVKAAVAEKGALDVNLLGMSFLGRLESFHLRGDELVLVQ